MIATGLRAPKHERFAPLVTRPEVSVDGRMRFASLQLNQDVNLPTSYDTASFYDLCDDLARYLELPGQAGELPVVIVFMPLLNGYSNVELFDHTAAGDLRTTTYTLIEQADTPDTLTASGSNKITSIPRGLFHEGEKIQFGWLRGEPDLSVVPAGDSLLGDYAKLRQEGDRFRKGFHLGKRALRAVTRFLSS